jgi:uncharacterized protein YciI
VVSGLFLLRQTRGPDWDTSRGRREQAGWAEHAAFIDRLTAAERILAAGPVGDVDGLDVVLIVRAASEAEARRIFAPDPWLGSVLEIAAVEQWTVWAGVERFASPE